MTRQRFSRRLGLQGKQDRSAAAKWRALVRRLRDMHWSRSLVVRCVLRVARCALRVILELLAVAGGALRCAMSAIFVQLG